MGQDLHGVIVHYRRSSASPVVQYSRSTIGVDGRSPGGLYEVGEACLAPTQIRPLLDRYGVRGRFRAPFPFAPAHSQRQSAKSAVRCSLCPEHSRSTIGVDGRSPGGLYEVGEACLAPTQICSLLDPGMVCVGVSIGVNLRNLRYLWFHLQIGKSPCAIHCARALQVGNRLHSGAHVLMLDKMVWCRAAAETVPSESFSGIRLAVGAPPRIRP